MRDTKLQEIMYVYRTYRSMQKGILVFETTPYTFLLTPRTLIPLALLRGFKGTFGSLRLQTRKDLHNLIVTGFPGSKHLIIP